MNSTLERVRSVVMILLVFFAVSACGVKTLPVPPTDKKPGVVTGLGHKMEGSLLTLSWNRSPGENGVRKYVVYRSRTPLSEERCDGCPVIFEKVAEVPASRLSHTEELERGFRYVYKVIAKTSGGLASDNSVFVRFEF